MHDHNALEDRKPVLDGPAGMTLSARAGGDCPSDHEEVIEPGSRSLQPAGISPKQLAANRRNALKSTGPRTVAGKRRSARNALTAGLWTRRILVPGESPEEFARFRNDMLDALLTRQDPHPSVVRHMAHPPPGPDVLEQALAERVVSAAWRLRRVQWLEADLLAQEQHTMRAQADGKSHACRHPVETDPVSQAPFAPGVAYGRLVKRGDPLGRLSQYEAGLERGLWRALHELERVQAERVGHPMEAARVVHIVMSK